MDRFVYLNLFRGRLRKAAEDLSIAFLRKACGRPCGRAHGSTQILPQNKLAEGAPQQLAEGLRKVPLAARGRLWRKLAEGPRGRPRRNKLRSYIVRLTNKWPLDDLTANTLGHPPRQNCS